MNSTPRWVAIAALSAVTVLAACAAAREPGPAAVQPGAPGESSRPVAVEPVADRALPPYTEADVRFIQGMIAHHQQALDMTALVPARGAGERVALLAERIEVSQQDEIAMMRRWLERRGEEVPAAGEHAHHHGAGGHGLMPGMLTPEEMARLAAARGPEFDRLFLEFMIRHHEGALVMVDELFASRGAGQGGEIFQLASEVAADQAAEIQRMRRLLAR